MEDLIYNLLKDYNVYVDDWYSDSYSKDIFITVNTISMEEDNYSDDENEDERYYFSFDIWGKQETKDKVKEIAKEVKIILKNNDFCFGGATILVEPDTEIFRINMDFNYLK